MQRIHSIAIGPPRIVRRRGSQRGAMLIEFALILPVLGALLIGMLSGGLAYNRKLSLTNGAREGARFAATLPVQNFANLNAWLDEVDAVAVGAVDDGLAASAADRYVCVAYVHPDGVISTDQTTRRVETDGTVSYTAAPCFSDGRPSSERRVQVVLERSTELDALIFRHVIDLRGRSVARFEALAG